MGCECTKVDLVPVMENQTVEVGQPFDVDLRAISQGDKPSWLGGAGIVIQWDHKRIQLVTRTPAKGLQVALYQYPEHRLGHGELHLDVFGGDRIDSVGLPAIPPADGATLVVLQFVPLCPFDESAISVEPLANLGTSRHRTYLMHLHNFGHLNGDFGAVMIEAVPQKPVSLIPVLVKLADRLEALLGDNPTPEDIVLLGRARMLAEAE